MKDYLKRYLVSCATCAKKCKERLIFFAFIYFLTYSRFDDGSVPTSFLRSIIDTTAYIYFSLAMRSRASKRVKSKWRTYIEVVRKRYESDESDDDEGTRVRRWTVKMLEFTGIYPLFFSCPLRCAYCRSLPTPMNVPRESLHSTRTVIRESTNLSAVPGQRADQPNVTRKLA